MSNTRGPGRPRMPSARQPAADPRGEAAIYAWLNRAVVDDVPPEPLNAEMAAHLATVLLLVMTDNVRHQLGLEPGHARAAALGWIAAKAHALPPETTGGDS